MSKIRCLIKYAPNIVDVSGAVVDHVDIIKKATDGIGRFNVILKNDNGEWLGQFGADDPIQIQINDIIFFEGFLDKGMPLAEAREDICKQMYEIVGRDYGQDLQNKIVNKTGDWMYEKQYADLILDDMLADAVSYILFTPTGDHKYGGADPIPQIAYTDRGDEFLQEAFRKIMEEINYDYYIDENKNLKIFPIGVYDSLIRLKNTKNLALSFNGVDNYVGVPYSSVLDVENELTLEAWIYSGIDFPDLAAVIGKYNSNIWCIFCHPAKRPRIFVYLTNNLGYNAIVPSDLNLNTWYHIVGTFKRNDKVRIYLDGVEVASASVPDYPLKTDTQSVGIGYIAGGNAYFNGIIDEVRIYNRALSEDEIKALYKNEREIKDGLVLHLPFDGDTKDYSGQGNHGTNYGATWTDGIFTPPVGNNILDLRKTEFDTFELRNYLLAKGDMIEDAWSDGNAADFTGETGNVITNELANVYNSVLSTTSIKSAKGTASKCSLQLAFPKYNYDELPFDLFGTENLVAWVYSDAATAWGHLYLELEDNAGNIIRWRFGLEYGPLGGEPWVQAGKWYQLVVPIGKDCSIRERPWWEYTKADRWEYSTKITTFNWKIKRIKFVADNSIVNYLLLDGLRIPFSFVSYKQDANSQTLYKVRHQPISARNVRSQIELDDLATGELEKVKAPIQGLRIVAVGSAGIIGGINKWIPGYSLKVNSPGDGINDTWWRMTEIHVSVAEYPLLKGHDFIAEITLVPYQTAISGKRLSYVDKPEIALIRALSDRVRFLEKKEEAKHDWFPAMTGPLGEKLLLSDFLSLADTNIAWTRRWEEYKFVNVHTNCSVVSDSQAANGKSLKIPSAAAAYDAFECPRVTAQVSGDFYIIFALKVTNNASSSLIARPRLIASGADRAVFDVHPNDFPTANKWHHFAIRGRIEADDTDVYPKLARYTLADVNLYCDFVGIVPANIPLGYSDVTVLGGTQNTTAGDATQNTSAQAAMQNTSAQSGFMGWTEIVNVIQSDYNLDTNWGVVLSGTAGSVTDPIDWSHYEIEITVTSGACDVFWRLKISGDYRIKDFRKSLPLDAQVKTLTFDIMLTSEQPYELSMKRVGDPTVVTVSLKIRQAKKHTHAMTNPSHDTGITNPAHPTAITNPSHGHGTSDPMHEH